MNQPIRFAVVGAGRSGSGGTGRGQSFINSAQHFSGEIEMTAICDTDPIALEQWRARSDIKCFDKYEDLLNDSEIDAVCISTPVPLHARQSIQALEAGKHVLSEVTANYELDEGWELIQAVEKSGRTYMMAENYCFMRPVLAVQNMVEQGVFGELTYATGAYIHDCRELYFTPEGELTWRGEVRRARIANTYPTHSMGPVCRWLGINRTDFLKTTATWQSKSAALSHYAARNLPQRVEYSDAKFWAHPDTTMTLIRTANGVLVENRIDWASSRPHHMTRYELQGTTASVTAPAEADGDWLIWIAGRSTASDCGTAHEWEPLSKYLEEFEHPLWREHLAVAEKSGHGGGDYFTLREFVSAIRENRPPLFDVYDAVTWSSLTPLSAMSIAQGNAPVEVPNFKAGRK